MRLVDAAKDWQDRLQSTLPGYRERIVSIYLKDNEGGLNLDMKSDVIQNLIDYGDRAGGLTTGVSVKPEDQQIFDFDEHRWRRFLVAFAAAEEILDQAARSWAPSGAGTRDFIQRYMDVAKSYHGDPAWRASVFERFDGLMTHVSGWKGERLADAKGAAIPRPRTRVRLSPKY
jgi:hypothetical protein